MCNRFFEGACDLINVSSRTSIALSLGSLVQTPAESRITIIGSALNEMSSC